MSDRHRLLVALLLDGEAAIEVQGLRRALGARPPWRIAPHVTLVPPRNVRSEDLAGVVAALGQNAATSRPFEAEIGPASTFAPERPVVYLQVGGDDGAIGRLAAGAASGALAPPQGRPSRELVPHVTVSSQVAEADVAPALTALAGYRRTYTFRTIHLLEQVLDELARPWRVVMSAVLGGSTVVGRGGRELDLTVADRLDPAAAAWVDEAWASYSRETYGAEWAPDEPFVVVARVDGAVVGVATGEVRGASCACARLVVEPASRGQGVGTQLLRHLERFAGERGCTQIRLRTLEGGPAERFFAARGFARSVVLPAWREGRDFVDMVRELGRS